MPLRWREDNDSVAREATTRECDDANDDIDNGAIDDERRSTTTAAAAAAAADGDA